MMSKSEGPFLHSVGTANPPLYVTQPVAYETYVRLFDLKKEEQELYRKLLIDGPIYGRHIGMGSTDEALEQHPDRLHERFLSYARRIGSQAARKALEQAKLPHDAVGGLVVNTCTGYLCPGLSSYIAEALDLPKDIRAVDLAGMGCGAALPNLECTTGLLHLNNARPLLSVAVEICTATMFMGPDPELVVSNCIFGDGASAALITATVDQTDVPPVARLLGFSSVLHPEHREQLRYRQEDGRLRNHLTRRVPVIGASLAAEALDLLFKRTEGLSPRAIRWWAVHGGGTAVLNEVADTFKLDASVMQYSLDVFRQFGNMSSPTVMFALDSIVRNARPAAGDIGVLLAFGAGFSAHAALIEFTGFA